VNPKRGLGEVLAVKRSCDLVSLNLQIRLETCVYVSSLFPYVIRKCVLAILYPYVSV
jgi:hypothetical protein